MRAYPDIKIKNPFDSQQGLPGKIFVPGLALLFIIFSVAAGYSQGQKNTISEIEKDSYSWDFGRVKEGAILKRTFIFKNESKTALSINNVSTSCGCTISKIKKKKLMPQETTPLTVQFNTKGYSGPVKQYVFLVTDNFSGSAAFSINAGPKQAVDSLIISLIIRAQVIKGGK